MQRLLKVIVGCPDGVTREALISLNEFTAEEIDRAAALCLIRVDRREVSGVEVIRYWQVKR